MEFKLTKNQIQRLNRWKKSLPLLEDIYQPTEGGTFIYTFTPNGLGVIVTVERIDGYRKDLTEWKYW